jgi:hypothetical protein
MRAMADAYDDMADGKIDAKTLMDSTIQINRDVYTQRDAIQDDVARRARTAIKPLAPTAARDLPLRQKLLDGNPTGDAYIRDMIAWLHAIDAAQLEPADAATCIEIVMRLEPLIDSYVQIGHGRGQDPGRVSAALQLVGDASGGLHKAIFTTLGKGIYDRVLAQRDRYQTRTERPLTAAASKSAPDALTSKRLPDALDVHPMSATRFQDLLEILGQYPDDADSWSRFGAAGDEIRGDEVIQSALPRHPPRDGDDRQADFDRWMDAKQQSLERVDAVDAELIRSVADDAPEERIALASAQARCWRRLPIDAAAAEQALRSRFDHLDLVASAAAAGLDLDDPHLASLLLTRTNEFAEIMESHAMACLRARGTPGAAVVAGSTGWATPNDILRPLRDATEEADKAARQAATDAVHEVAAFLPHDQVPAWRRAVAHAAWPCLSRPVDEARSIHVVAVATAPPDVEAALKAAFANLLTDALALQDEITPILINQPLSATTERMKGDDRIRIHARFERTTQRVQQWRDEFNEILSGRPAVAAHP